MNNPYASAALYFTQGIEPIPTPFKDKKPVPFGYTGGIKSRTVTKQKMNSWIRRGFLVERGLPILNNLGILLPDGWLGIDVDAHSGKPGGDTKRRLEKEFGPWPETAVSTNRDDGVSGVYLFKGLPLDTAWKTGSKAGEGLDGIDLVKWDYRHVQAYPSVHQSGRPYRWLNTTAWVPMFADEIADISHMTAFIDFLKKGDGTRGAANQALPAELAELEEWIDNLQEGEQCYATYEALERYTHDLDLGSSHPVLVSLTRALVGLGQAGHLGVAQALDTFELVYETSLAHREGSSDPFEFQKAVLWALGKEKANRDQATGPCKCTFTGGELFEYDETGNLVEPPVAKPREVSRKDKKASPGLTYTKASDIVMKPIHWLWEGYIPLGELTLLAGAEGEGKSSISVDFAADLSNGHMRGHFKGIPRSVAITTAEDSWERTVAPRLRAAGANMNKVFRVEAADYGGGVMLPRDISTFENDVGLMGFGMLILDPLNSTLDAALDTHKDAEVRRALEPLVAMAERTGCSVVGLIHLNKAKTTNPMTALMGSRAYGAVARAVLFVDRLPDEPDIRVLGLPKSNLGVSNPPSLMFTIEGRKVGEFEGEDITASKIVWKGESPLSIRDVMESTKARTGGPTAAEEAQDWLSNFLQERAECVPSADVKMAAEKVGISAQRLKGAAKVLGVSIKASGFPRTTCWEDAGQHLFGEVEGYDDI